MAKRNPEKTRTTEIILSTEQQKDLVKNILSTGGIASISWHALKSETSHFIMIAHLIMRITDDIADSLYISIALKKKILTILEQAVKDENDIKKLSPLLLKIPMHPSLDLKFIFKLTDLLTLMHAYPSDFKEYFIDMFTCFKKACFFDIHMIVSNNKNNILQTQKDFDLYIYQVAGCIGEFFARSLLRFDRTAVNMSEEKAVTSAIHFGKAFQIINILGDLSFDVFEGRIYIPLSELKKHNINPLHILSNPRNLSPILNSMRMLSLQHLQKTYPLITSCTNKIFKMTLIFQYFVYLSLLEFYRTDAYYQKLTKPKKIKLPFYKYISIGCLSFISLFFFQTIDRYIQRKFFKK